MLFLCLRFPYLPLEVFNKRYQGAGLSVVEESRKVVLANEQAKRHGVKVGMSMATVRTLVDCDVYSRSTLQEQQCLRQLAQLAYCYTPAVGCYRNDALILDIGNSLRLYKGLPALLKTLQDNFKNLPLDYCYGIAHTAKAAWLLSYCAQDNSEEQLSIQSLSVEKIQQQLSMMPVTLLMDFPDVVQHLQHSGIQRLGQLLAIPMAELGKRFGLKFVNYLQELTGERVELQSELVLPPAFGRSVDCLYAVNDWQQLLLPMKDLLIELTEYLAKHQLQCSEVYWYLWSPDNQSVNFKVSCQRVFSQWSVLLELTQIKLNCFTIDMTVETVELRCEKFTKAQLLTPSLFEENCPSQESFQALIVRLNNRFDNHSLYQLQQKDSHIPELAYEFYPATGHIPKEKLQAVVNDRPCWLLAQPQQLNHRKEKLYWHGPLNILQGPERIEANWWQQAVSRDYFVAINQNNQRCWIFRDRLQENMQRQWYLHGLFA